MIDYHFSFESEEQANELLPLLNGSDGAIDVVGIIFRPTGNTVTDDLGLTYDEMAPVPGWHVNVRLLNTSRRDEFDALEEYIVHPATPERIWA